MKDSLIKKFQSLQRSKNDVLRSLSDYNEDLLNASEEGKWSVAQVLFHLYLSEKLTLLYLQKTLEEKNSFKSAGFGEWLRSKLLKLALVLPIKYKAPKNLGHPPELIEWDKFLRDWGETRDELYQFINDIPEEVLPKAIFKHPRAGMLNMSQTLDFFDDHFMHHLPQVKNHSSITKPA